MFNSLTSYLFGYRNSDIDKKEENCDHQENSKANDTITKLNTNLPLISDIELLSTETEEEDWLLIDKEEEESLPRTDSEEELPFVEIKRSPTNNQSRYRRNNSRSASRTVSPVHINNNSSSDGIGVSSQPLYTVSSSLSSAGVNNHRSISSMEESWFLTPPPCFTSTGPVNMESSPFENLLIEHPSMSVYHSIRSAQGAAESFVDFDLGTEEAHSDLSVVEQSPVRSVQNARRTSQRVETLTHQQAKQGLLLRNSQKIHEKKERQNICRGALKRGNKVRDFNSRGKSHRRSDMQHCKIISGANNNRKC